MDGVPALFSKGGIIFVKYGVLGKLTHKAFMSAGS